MQGLADNPLLVHLLIAAVIVAAFVLFARPVRSLLGFVGHKIITRTENVLDDRILDALLTNVCPAMILIGLHIALREIHKGAVPSDQTLLQILEYAGAILFIAVILVALRAVLGVIREILNWYIDRISGEGTPQLKMTLGPLTSRVMDLVIGLVGVIVILDHFGVNIGSLLVSLGVGSLAVALAAQDTLANMIAGFVILVDRPFRVGDRVELEWGQVGDVKEIGLRSTRVMNFDNNLIIIPNAELVKREIVNYSHPYAAIRVVLRFDLAYGTESDVVRDLLLRLAKSQPAILQDPEPKVFVTAVTDSALQVTLVMRCSSFTEQYAVETTLRELAYREFRERGIAMAIPHRIVQMKGEA